MNIADKEKQPGVIEKIKESKWYKNISRIAVGFFYTLTGLCIMIIGLSISSDILIRDLGMAAVISMIVLSVSIVWTFVFIEKGIRRIYN